MKKLLFLFAAVLFTAGVANATTYSGTVHATQMNGSSVNSTITCSYDVNSNGILSGIFSTGPHDITMQSLQAITGPGTYDVEGTITLGGLGLFPFSGVITVTSYSDTTLEFECVATAWGFLESIFSFSGTAS